MSTCIAKARRTGDQCRRKALDGFEYCLNHSPDPEHKARYAAMVSAGGAAHKSPPRIAVKEVDLSTREGVFGALNDLFTMALREASRSGWRAATQKQFLAIVDRAVKLHTGNSGGGNTNVLAFNMTDWQGALERGEDVPLDLSNRSQTLALAAAMGADVGGNGRVRLAAPYDDDIIDVPARDVTPRKKKRRKRSAGNPTTIRP